MLRPARLLKSFRHALRGWRTVFAEEQNFRIHVVAGLSVFIAGVWVGLTPRDFCLVILAVAVLLITEIINTVLEKMIDLVKPRVHLDAGIIKDAAAGAVLIAAMGAAGVVILVFWPHFLKIFSNLF